MSNPIHLGLNSQVSCLQRLENSSTEHHSIILTHTHISGLVPHTSGIGQHKGVLVFVFRVDCGPLLEEGMDQEVWEGRAREGGEERRGEERGGEERRGEERRGDERRGEERGGEERRGEERGGEGRGGEGRRGEVKEGEERGGEGRGGEGR